MNDEIRNKSADGVWEIFPEELARDKAKYRIIDVRREEEYTGELGHIAGAELCTLQTKFQTMVERLEPSQAYVFVCRSGQRSEIAAAMAVEKGVAQAYNLVGGMLAWNDKGLPVEFE